MAGDLIQLGYLSRGDLVSNEITEVIPSEKDQTTLLFYTKESFLRQKLGNLVFLSYVFCVRGGGLDSRVSNNATELILQYFP